ncbi:hypothetical protein Pfo_016363 [Paulownia fortunei]|nr:hypothetical protein Pfo_016363 [Paulownia fortunei]
MSRCFPFPPPGYEKKHRLEDLDVLKEAKHKDKRQRKDKKDKERRKEKIKREKDGSGEKQREKKDRKGKHKDKKEKHRDKKKDKEDRGKDKDKSSISEESTVAGKLGEKSGEKLHPKGYSKNRSSVVDEGKCSTLFQGQNEGKPFQSILPAQATREAKFVQELDRRIRDDEKGRGSQFPERVSSADKMDQEAAPRTAVWNPPRILAEAKDNYNDKRVDIRKMEIQELENEFTGKAMVQNITRVAKSKDWGIPRPVEELYDWRLEDKEKYKERGDDKWGDKHKDRDTKSHGKDTDREKEKKKEEKGNVKIENKKNEHGKSKDVGRNDLVGATSNKSTNLLKDVESVGLNEGNIRKRKDMDTNGFLHESEIGPNKIQRPALHQSTENVRKLEASRPSKSCFDKHAVPNNIWLINGIMEAQIPSPSKPNPSAATIIGYQTPKIPHYEFSNANEALTVPKMEDHIAEASRRPPHPDSKYLSQLLTVPKVGDWSENDDQDWLFCKKGPPSKPKLELAGVKQELLVWSEAVHIESADVDALPYVIPY